jgi:hypothetical protein
MNRLRQIVTVFLVGLTFFVMQALGNGVMPAQADNVVKSTEGVYYKGTPDGGNVNSGNNLVNSARKNLKETADNVKGTAENVRDRISDVGDKTVKTPEGVYYKAVPDEDRINKSNDLSENAQGGLKAVADNVREKLNLDEPLPRSTKEFLRSTEKRVENAVEPVTGQPEGYYQEPPTVR